MYYNITIAQKWTDSLEPQIRNTADQPTDTHSSLWFRMLRGLHFSAWSLTFYEFWPLRECLFSTIISSCALMCFNLMLKISSMAALNKSKPCGLLSVQPLRTSPAHKSLILDLSSMQFQYPPLAELLMNIKHLNRSRLLIYECRQMSFYTGSSYTGGQNKTKQNKCACRPAEVPWYVSRAERFTF